MQKRSLQCAQHQVGAENELWFSKSPGHEQFHASLNAVRLAFSLTKQERRWDLEDMRSLTTTAVNHQIIKHQCSGEKFSRDPVFDEAIEQLEGTP